ncbi:MAG: flavodoxin family protein [Clostridia bacterium]|nr:flavodoxin family protein [Clostridia bacterium]MDE7215586.1 flavodoxin family protein [Clostridia bacterium]
MKVLILTGSPRKGGNTDILAEAFAVGARENHDVEILNVCEYKINPCVGCNSCFSRENNKCFQDDGMQIIYDKTADADMLVVASPVYFYGISAQLKAVIDRFHTPARKTFNIKKTALLLTAGSSKSSVFDAIVRQYELIVDYFKFEDKGMLLVGGVNDKGAINGREELRQAYILGKSIQ